jgi:hypothetical protein
VSLGKWKTTSLSWRSPRVIVQQVPWQIGSELNFHVGVVQNENARTHTQEQQEQFLLPRSDSSVRGHILKFLCTRSEKMSLACKQMGGSDVLGAVNTANRAINMQITAAAALLASSFYAISSAS